MIVLGYIGDHKKDTLMVRAGWRLTRSVQRGQFARVTHVEAYLGKYKDGRSRIASASLRDGGVRIKYVELTPENWMAIEVPGWNADTAYTFIALQNGKKYDARGALATVFPFAKPDDSRWFCNELIGAAVGIVSPEIFGPAQFMALAASMPGAKILDIKTLLE